MDTEAELLLAGKDEDQNSTGLCDSPSDSPRSSASSGTLLQPLEYDGEDFKDTAGSFDNAQDHGRDPRLRDYPIPLVAQTVDLQNDAR